MKKSLLALLVATGVTIGGVSLYAVKPGVTDRELQAATADAGCVSRAAEAEFLVSKEGQQWLDDAGLKAPKYARMQFPVAVCGDAGIILPQLPKRDLDLFQVKAISLTTCAARPGVCQKAGEDRPFVLVPNVCAWRPKGAKDCTKVDGGNPGDENTMQPGEFAGPGCVRKACVEVAGESSAP